MELIGRGVSERLACRLVGINRSSYRYPVPTEPEADIVLRATIRELARANPRYGYRQITASLPRRGERVNPKRVWRGPEGTPQEEGLLLPGKRLRKRQRGEPNDLPTRAPHRGHVWTYDFVFGRTDRGQALKLLVVLDEFTQECRRIRMGERLNNAAVIATLDDLFLEHGAPAYLRSDNGEFIAEPLKTWLAQQGTKKVYIEPGHPCEIGVAGSFNGKFRDECLNQEVFWGETHAQVVVERWQRTYNEERTHSTLGYRTPGEVAQALSTSNAWTSGPAINQRG